jgi:putative inorganic carbon (HCO3(-)) transporter
VTPPVVAGKLAGAARRIACHPLRWLAGASTVAVLFSIAVSQVLLGAAVVALAVGTVNRADRRPAPLLPPVWPALALFMAGTLTSLAFSDAPAAGWPQIRKFYVYLTVVVVYAAFRAAWATGLVLWWAAAGAAAAAFGIAQFLRHVAEARASGGASYQLYLDERITGFMGHWQTFGGEQMIVLLMMAAFLLFSPRARGWRLALGLCAAALLAAAILLGYTRGIWLATACAGLYLVGSWRPRLLLAVPVVLGLVLWLNPGYVRNRFESGFRPHSEDSNEQHILCWRTGWEMVQAHPWFGVGPERVGPEFLQYAPADIPRPLPKGWYGHLHSVYIHYAAERGIPTMLALVAALLKMLWDYRRALRRLKPGPSETRFLLHGATAVVIGAMVSGLFEVNLGDSEVLALFLAAVALGYVASERSLGGRLDAEAPA